MIIAIAQNDGEIIQRRILWVMVLAGAIYCLLEMFVVLMGLVSGFPVRPSLLAQGYSNYRFWNHVQTVQLPLLATAVVASRDNLLLRMLAWFALVTGFALAIFEEARATILSVLVSGLVAVWINRVKLIPIMKVLLVGIFLGLGLSFLLFSVAPWMIGYEVPEISGSRVTHFASDSSRVYLWGIAIGKFMESPWVGIGPMHFANIHNLKAAHPHNIYLQIAVEWGVGVLGMVLACISVFIKRLCKKLSSAPVGFSSDIGAGLLVAVISALMDGAVSGNFVMPVSQVWIAACIGWSILWMRGGELHPNLAGKGVGVRYITITVGIVSILLFIDVSISFTSLDGWLSQSKSMIDTTRLAPRFWSSGWF